MADYINRDDVLKAIDYQHEVNHVFESEAAYVQMWETINDDIGIKSADVQLVKKCKMIPQKTECGAEVEDGEFYERECKIEDAMEDAIIKACELAEIVFASEGEDGLCKYRMTKEIPSALHDFAWRFRAELEDLGYIITERQQTTND